MGWAVGVAGCGADGCRGEFGGGGFTYGERFSVEGGWDGGFEGRQGTEDESTGLAEDFDG